MVAGRERHRLHAYHRRRSGREAFKPRASATSDGARDLARSRWRPSADRAHGAGPRAALFARRAHALLRPRPLHLVSGADPQSHAVNTSRAAGLRPRPRVVADALA